MMFSEDGKKTKVRTGDVIQELHRHCTKRVSFSLVLGGVEKCQVNVRR